MKASRARIPWNSVVTCALVFEVEVSAGHYLCNSQSASCGLKDPRLELVFQTCLVFRSRTVYSVFS